MSNETQLSLFPANDNDPRGTKPARNDIRNGDAAEAYVLAKLLLALMPTSRAAMRRMTSSSISETGGTAVSRSKGRGGRNAGDGRSGSCGGNPRTGAGTYAYGDTDYDVVAVVALPLERAIFLPGVQRAPIRLSTADFLRSGGEAQSMARAFAVFDRAA